MPEILHPSTSTSLGHLARTGTLAGSMARTVSTTAFTATKPTSAVRAGRNLGPDDERGIQIAGLRHPRAGETSAPGGLPVGQDDGAFRRTVARVARGKVVGAGDRGDADQPHGGRQPANSAAAATFAQSSNGPG